VKEPIVFGKKEMKWTEAELQPDVVKAREEIELLFTTVVANSV
jgi:hypothetical protein